MREKDSENEVFKDTYIVKKSDNPFCWQNRNAKADLNVDVAEAPAPF